MHPYSLRAFQRYQEHAMKHNSVLGDFRETKKNKGGGVTHCGLAIYIKKYLKAKKIFMKIQIFHHAKKYNLQKNPLKETKILQDIITLYNKSQVSTLAKIYHLSKILI
jgi:hypothetical protein